MTEWFEQWFGEEYLQLYPHRDHEDAKLAVDLIDEVTTLRGARVLDLGCGTGRHAVQMALHGATVVGFDLSMPLLSRARHGTPPVTRLVRGDMRTLPFRKATFDVVVNLFTSFGYFTDDEQHATVLREASHALVASGTFVLDYLNAESVRNSMVSHEERSVGTQTVAIERRLTPDGRFVVKEMHLVNDGRSFVERVRLFLPEELRNMMGEAGLVVVRQFGDYHGGALTDGAPRTVLVAERQ